MALPDMLDPGYEQVVVRRAPDSPLDLPTTNLTPQPVLDRAPRRAPARWLGEVRAYSPTMREKSVARVQDVLEERLGVDRASAIRMAETVLGGPGSNLPLGAGLIDIPMLPSAPFLMEESARSVGQAGRAFEQGDYSGALASYGAAVLQGIPGAAALKMLTPVVARGAQQILNESLTQGGRRGQRGIFLAEKWWTPQEQAARRVAEDLEAQGATPEDVLVKTGLVRDLDGSWAVEISDDAMKFRGLEAVRAARATVAKRADDIQIAMDMRTVMDRGGTVDNAARDYRARTGTEPPREAIVLAQQRSVEQLEAAMQNTMASLTAPIKGLRLQDVIEHPELFDRIPDLADMQVDFLLQKDMPGAVAQYTPGAPGSIQLLSKTLSGAPGAARLDVGHELQHTVDFPTGGARGYGTSVGVMNLADQQLKRSTQNAADIRTTFENAQAVRRLMDANPGMSADAAFDRLLDEGNYFGSSQDYAKPGVTVNPETGQKYTELGSKRNPVLDIAAITDSAQLDQAVKDAIDAVRQAYSKEREVTRTPPFQRYMSERGEARARLTERRLDLSPEERRQMFPMRQGPQAMDMPPEQTKSLYELTGGLYGLRGQTPAMPSASMGAEAAPPAGPPLRDLLSNEPTTLRTLENLPQNRPYIPISTIREQLRRADVTKAEKDVLESIIAGRDDFISAEELVNAVRARSEPFRLSPADTQSYADYGFDRIGRDTTGRPWVGRGPNAANARTTIHQSPTPTSPNNHFNDPNYFGHTRAFEADGIPHVVEIQSDLVQQAARELTEAERTSLEEGVRAIDDQRKIIDSLVKSTPMRLNYYDDAADLFEKTLPKLEELNPDAKFMIGRYLLNAPGVRGRSLQEEEAVDYVLRVLRDDWAGTERSASSSALRNALDDFNYALDVRRSENRSKLAAKAEATAQRPMFKNWERRLIREEIARAAADRENAEKMLPFYKQQFDENVSYADELRRAQAIVKAPPVIRFADADTVALVEGWPNRLRELQDGLEAARRDLQNAEAQVAAGIDSSRDVGLYRSEVEDFEAQISRIDPENPFYPKHQGIYNRYNKEVANYLKSLGAKRVTDEFGVGWWEVPIKPQQKRVQLFSMGGGAVTVGGGVAAPGDFGYTVPTEED